MEHIQKYLAGVLVAVTLGMGSMVMDTNSRLDILEVKMDLLVTTNNEIISSPTNALARAKLQAEIDLIKLEMQHVQAQIDELKNKGER